jgi:hypothetical protein
MSPCERPPGGVQQGVHVHPSNLGAQQANAFSVMLIP